MRERDWDWEWEQTWEPVRLGMGWEGCVCEYPLEEGDRREPESRV